VNVATEISIFMRVQLATVIPFIARSSRRARRCARLVIDDNIKQIVVSAGSPW